MADIDFSANTRFWSKVRITGDEDCWEWTATKNKGYGLFRIGRVKVIASRCAWEIANRKRIPDGLFACHTCDNPGCCNPRHIYTGTPKQNSDDMIARRRSRSGDTSGERNGTAKLTWAKVAAIRERLAAGECTWRISNDYDVTNACIRSIERGRTWIRTNHEHNQNVAKRVAKPPCKGKNDSLSH